MKTNAITRIYVNPTGSLPSSVERDMKGTAVMFVDATRVVPTTATLYLRLHITNLAGAGGQTKDKLQWANAENATSWSDFPEGGKVIIAEFGKDDDTAVRVLGKAFVVQSNGTSSLENIELAIQDWEQDGVRKADLAGSSGVAIDIKTGKFDLDPTGGLAAYHDVNFNIIVKLGTSYFVFDPLVIIVPKRP